MKYKFRENELIEEFKKYVEQTYDQHYATNKYQATDVIIDSGHGTGFCLGNVIKYAKRYGRKGNPDEWRKDVMKILHYALIQLHIHDEENKKVSSQEQLERDAIQRSSMMTAPGHHSLDDVTPEDWNKIR